MSNIKYICAQPDELYYAWQVEVMLDNFLSVGIPAGDIHILVGIKKHIGEWWIKLADKYEEVGFFFYEDRRPNSIYPPSICPYLMHEHYSRFPYLYSTPVFYHDCDILFTRTPDFTKFLNDDVWYLSDTVSYIGADYILSKISDGEFVRLCGHVGIGRKTVIGNQLNSGGAQHIIKNTYTAFWTDVYGKSEELYNYLSRLDSDIQRWTAGMWAFLWTAWIHGHETKVDPYLNFSMATDTWPKWDKNLIYHNAGAVPGHDGKLFLKDQYRGSLPYTQDNPYDRQFCSYKYYDQVTETGKTSCLKDEPLDMNVLLSQCKSIFINK